MRGFTLPKKAEERRILGSFKASKDEGFDALYRGYAKALTGFCLGRLTDPHEAGDACHEALIKAHRSRDGFRDEAPIWPWLATIAAHVCSEFNHDRARPVPVAPEPGDEGVDEQAARLVRGDILRRAMLRLPPHYRSLLYLKHCEQRTYGEIVEALGLTEPKVRSALTRARKALRTEVERVARDRKQWPLPGLVPAPVGTLVRIWQRLDGAVRGAGTRISGLLEPVAGMTGGVANLVAAVVVAASIQVAPVNGIEVPPPSASISKTTWDEAVAEPESPEANEATPPVVGAEVAIGGRSEEAGSRTYEGPSARVATEVGEHESGDQETDTGSTFVNCPPPEERSAVMGPICGALETLPQDD